MSGSLPGGVRRDDLRQPRRDVANVNELESVPDGTTTKGGRKRWTLNSRTSRSWN